MDNSVSTGACFDCGRSGPSQLLLRNAGRCFTCVCAEMYRVDHELHRELERTDPRPTIPQGRS